MCSDVDISPWDDRLGIYGVHEDALRRECQYRAFSSSVLPMQEDRHKPKWRGQCQKCHLRCPAIDAGLLTERHRHRESWNEEAPCHKPEPGKPKIRQPDLQIRHRMRLACLVHLQSQNMRHVADVSAARVRLARLRLVGLERWRRRADPMADQTAMHGVPINAKAKQMISN